MTEYEKLKRQKHCEHLQLVEKELMRWLVAAKAFSDKLRRLEGRNLDDGLRCLDNPRGLK